MRLGVLFSGGKDSTLALHLAYEKHEIACLITMESKNKESYMFHTPNIDLTSLQAEALGLPLIKKETQGIKEEELSDLEAAIAQAKSKFNLDGIVTGAVESVYQSKRIQNICDRLGIACLNPLWNRNQQALLEELVEKKFKVLIVGIFAYPLDEKWLGKEITPEIIARLVDLQKQYGLSPSGEGGEIETIVLDAPLFMKKIKILDYSVEARGNAGVLKIKMAELTEK